MSAFLGRDGLVHTKLREPRQAAGGKQVPDELRFRVHVSHTVLCKPLVQTVECGSQEAPNDPHHDEETQIHSCPEVTFFIRVRALREGAREGERKTRVPMRAGRDRSREDRNKRRICFPSTRAKAELEACPHRALSMHRRLTGQKDPIRSSAYPSDHCSLVL